MAAIGDLPLSSDVTSTILAIAPAGEVLQPSDDLPDRRAPVAESSIPNPS